MLCDTVLAEKTRQNNTDLLFLVANYSGCAVDVFDDLLDLCFIRHGFLAHVRSMKAIMRRKLSVLQSAQAVPWALTSDKVAHFILMIREPCIRQHIVSWRI